MSTTTQTAGNAPRRYMHSTTTPISENQKALINQMMREQCLTKWEVLEMAHIPLDRSLSRADGHTIIQTLIGNRQRRQ